MHEHYILPKVYTSFTETIKSIPKLLETKGKFLHLGEHKTVEVFKTFFDIKEIKNIKLADENTLVGIATMNDESIHAVLDIEPIDYYSSSKEKQEEIRNKLHDLLKNINFPMQILIRTLNHNILDKIKIMNSKIAYDLKKLDDKILINKYSIFYKWFERYINKNCRPSRKCYLVVPYNKDFYGTFKKGQFEKAKEMLCERLKDVRRDLERIGLKVDILRNTQLINLYNSFIRDTIYTEKGYLTPSKWLREYRNYQEGIKETGIFEEEEYKVETEAREIINKIKEKKHLHFSELDNYWSGMPDNEKEEILKLIKRHPDIKVDVDTFEYKKSIIEHDLYDLIMQVEKIDLTPNYMRTGNTYIRGITASGYPRYIDNDFLKAVFELEKNLDIAIHLMPALSHDAESYLKRRLREIDDALHILNEKGETDKELEFKKEELTRHLTDIKEGKMFSMSLFFAIYGNNIEELSNLGVKLISLIRANKIILKPTTNYEKQLIKSIAPTCINYLKRREIIITSNLLSNNFLFVKI